MAKPVFYYKSTCSTCRKAKTLLNELGVAVEERDMSRQPLSAAEVGALIGERELRPFVNTRTEMYREQKMKDGLPDRETLVHLMGENANLIRRPLLVDGDQILYGFDEGAYREFAARKE